MCEIIKLDEILLKKWDKTIINNLSWQVKKGEHWALLGLNGSGKTSLLKIITGYEWPSTGKVSVLGNTYGTCNLQEVRKKIGWVSTALDDRFQTRTNDTVLEVILSGKMASIGLYEDVTPEEIDHAEQIAQRFNILHLINEPIGILSQGEKRKTFLARAWMGNPDLLILDEPCNGLDVYSRESLLETIEELSSLDDGPTIIYVSHHIEEMVRGITNALILKEGQVVDKGKKEEVITARNLEAAFNLPLKLSWEGGRAWIAIKGGRLINN
ncbi:ABC transporter ATP-binding protein [Alkalihalobacterium alkalinitrilicum]|uniref:ABC transporter ATP-binding protein n=1 Tax=Alkalihalobacterium alkalinitrilicum TaxID=427920 RepID=UPI000995CF86|nr:ABC transporter ATP-binding protein [Alkalihalobacterium alkalinitrilicum]